jgi:hypothetical protein
MLSPSPSPLLRTGLDACLGGAALAQAAFCASGVLPILPLFFGFVVLVTIHLYDPLLTGLLTPLHSASGIPCLTIALWIRPIKAAPRLWDKWVSALSHSLILDARLATTSTHSSLRHTFGVHDVIPVVWCGCVVVSQTPS